MDMFITLFGPVIADVFDEIQYKCERVKEEDVVQLTETITLKATSGGIYINNDFIPIRNEMERQGMVEKVENLLRKNGEKEMSGVQAVMKWMEQKKNQMSRKSLRHTAIRYTKDATRCAVFKLHGFEPDSDMEVEIFRTADRDTVIGKKMGQLNELKEFVAEFTEKETRIGGVKGIDANYNPNPSKFYLVCLCLRNGTSQVMTRLEHFYYPPETEKNDEFELSISTWNEQMYAIIGIPIGDREICEKVVKMEGMRIADGVPTLISNGAYEYFPMRGPNVFTLENNTRNFKGTRAQIEAETSKIIEDARKCRKRFNNVFEDAKNSRKK